MAGARRTWKPVAAGILSIVAGMPGLGGGIAMVLIGGGVTGLQFPAWLDYLSGADLAPALSGISLVPPLLLGAVGAVILPLGLLGVLGGVEAIRRRHWRFALAGSICAGTIIPLLGILSAVLTAQSRTEFEGRRRAPSDGPNSGTPSH